MGLKIIAIDVNFGFTDIVSPVQSFGAFVLQRWLQSCKVMSVSDMVLQVLKIAGSQKIEELIIVGHGAPGYQSVGCGKEWDPTGDKSLTWQPGAAKGTLLGTAATAIAMLAGHFTNNGIVILGGCEVAAEGTRSAGAGVSFPVDGKDLLRSVSRILGGITVEAGTANQNAFSPVPLGNVIRCNDDSYRVASGWWY